MQQQRNGNSNIKNKHIHLHQGSDDNANNAREEVRAALHKHVAHSLLELGGAILGRGAALETTEELHYGKDATEYDGKRASARALSAQLTEAGNDQRQRREDSQNPAPRAGLLEVDVLATELLSDGADCRLSGRIASGGGEIVGHVLEATKRTNEEREVETVRVVEE